MYLSEVGHGLYVFQFTYLQVLIEAVENHMPQVIVIDEIGTKLEAIAASTIAERGIQLVATAHGATIENLIKNPSLDLLVGGVQVRHKCLHTIQPHNWIQDIV